MQGLWVTLDYNNVFFSKARSMARFGLLLLANGIWNGNDLLQDSAYFYQMTHASQDINQAYGYLTWLNNTENFMLPEYQFVYPGNFSPAAPQEMYAAMGRDGQYISVVPSQNLVWIRMGENPDQLNVPILMIDDIWEYINAMGCEPNSISDPRDSKVDIYPNPARDQWNISGITNSASWTLFDAFGNELQRNLTNGNNATIDCSQLAPGVYYIEIIVSGGKVIQEKIIKQ
ncbi:MAG: T9SS type A sorting domain-containing protein, partial [Flavobacteriales bacterium]